MCAKVEYMDSKAAFSELSQYLQNVEFDDFLRRPEHKKMREQFIAAQFCAGYRKYTGKKWFLRMEKHDPPDFKITYKDNDESYSTGEVEIATLPENALRGGNYEEQIIDIIQESKINKVVTGRENQILCISLDFDKSSLNLSYITEKLTEFELTYKEIWLVYICRRDLKNMGKTDFALQSIWPVVERIEFNLLEL